MTEKQLAGIARSVELREARAQLKRDLRSMTVTFDEALGQPCVQSMRVYDLARARFARGSKYGHAQTDRLLAKAGVLLGAPLSPYRKISDLTGRQKRALVQACEGSKNGQ